MYIYTCLYNFVGNSPFKLILAYILSQFNNRALKVIIVELIGFVLLLIALASTL